MDLYLQSFGSRLRVKDGIFEVTVPDITGANRHLVEQLAPHEVWNIMLQRGSSISTDALELALEKSVDVLVLNKFGHPIGRLWPIRPTSTLSIWKNQLHLSHSPEGLRIAKTWIEEKIQARITHLRKLKGYRKPEKVKIIAEAESAILKQLSRLRRFDIHDFDQSAASIRGMEGTAGKHYLAALSDLLPEEYQFEGRSARPSLDTFNAFLNYGYGILYRKVERALLLAGLHPYIGFMHADDYQQKSLVFDFVEPFRMWIDKVVFRLFSGKQVLANHVTAVGDNGVWLAEDGRRLLQKAVQERFEQKRKAFGDKLYDLDGYLYMAARRFAAQVLHGRTSEVLLGKETAVRELEEIEANYLEETSEPSFFQ